MLESPAGHALGQRSLPRRLRLSLYEPALATALANPDGTCRARTPKDTQPTPTTVSLPAAQFVARHKPFVADFNVPQADNHDLAGRSFVVVVQNAEPVTRQRVNYALKELKERNLINVQYSTITVTDMHQLEVLSNSQ